MATTDRSSPRSGRERECTVEQPGGGIHRPNLGLKHAGGTAGGARCGSVADTHSDVAPQHHPVQDVRGGSGIARVQLDEGQDVGTACLHPCGGAPCSSSRDRGPHVAWWGREPRADRTEGQDGGEPGGGGHRRLRRDERSLTLRQCRCAPACHRTVTPSCECQHRRERRNPAPRRHRQPEGPPRVRKGTPTRILARSSSTCGASLRSRVDSRRRDGIASGREGGRAFRLVSNSAVIPHGPRGPDEPDTEATDGRQIRGGGARDSGVRTPPHHYPNLPCGALRGRGADPPQGHRQPIVPGLWISPVTAPWPRGGRWLTSPHEAHGEEVGVNACPTISLSGGRRLSHGGESDRRHRYRVAPHEDPVGSRRRRYERRVRRLRRQ